MAATESISRIKTARGTHRLTFRGYSLNKGAGAGRCIRSATFTVGGYHWCICFYPDGKRGDDVDRDYVSVFLRLVSRRCKKVRACFQIRLLDQATGLPAAVSRRWNAPAVFVPTSPDSSSFGLRAFMERSKLEASTCIRHDCVVIECIVRVVVDANPVVSTLHGGVSSSALPPSNILQQLEAHLKDEEGSDVTFAVQGETFKAHRMMLAARSPVFKAELYGPMKEKDADHVITVSDVQPAVFKALLHFIYTDAIPPDLNGHDDNDDNDDDSDGDGEGAARSRDMARHLLVAADRYAVDRLRVICERALCRSLDIETVMETLALADQLSCSELKDACVQFVGGQSEESVMETEGYKNLKMTCPSLVVDMWERIVRQRTQ